MASRVEKIDPEFCNIGEVLGAGWMNLAKTGVRSHVCIDLGEDHVIAFFDTGEGTMVALWNLENAKVVASADIDRRVLLQDLDQDGVDEVLEAISKLCLGFVLEGPHDTPWPSM